MKLFRSLKSTRWLTWSSPLLLLVLVLTLTATSKAALPVAAAPPMVTTSSTTTSLAIATPPATTTTTAQHVTKDTTTSTTAASTLTSSLVSTRTQHANNSSHKTDSNVRPVVVASGESVTSGVLSGQLTPSFNVADVPLDGPGTWTLDTSAPATATLQCAGASTSVQGQIVIAAKSSCQFIITPITRSNSLTWQLTPVS